MTHSGRWVVAAVVLPLFVVSSDAHDAAAGVAGHHMRTDTTISAERAGSLSATSVAYRAPVSGRLTVVRPFQRPPNPYAAGHRGVDLAAPVRGTIVAAAAGRVGFAGSVAGRGVVVVVHADGVSTEYEPVVALVRAGQLVAGGQPIGQVRGQHGPCPVDACLHWGARRHGSYFDPRSLLRPLGPVRLLPWQ